jgi:hypothetical protein
MSHYTSICFGLASSPSSGGNNVYMWQLICVVFLSGLSAGPPAEIMSSNPTGSMEVCLLCVLSGRGRCDELIIRPEGVLPTVAHRYVWSCKPRGREGHSPRWAAEPKTKYLEVQCWYLSLVPFDIRIFYSTVWIVVIIVLKITRNF